MIIVQPSYRVLYIPPAPAGDLVYDSFTGTNGTVLSAHTGETNATWSYVAGWGTLNNSFILMDGKLMLADLTTNSMNELYTVSGQITNVNWSLEVGFIVTSTADYALVNIFTGNSVYGANWPLLTFRSDLFSVDMEGGYVTYAHGQAWTLGQQYLVKVVATGNKLDLYFDNVFIGTHTTTDIVTPIISINLVRGAGNTSAVGLTHLRVT